MRTRKDVQVSHCFTDFEVLGNYRDFEFDWIQIKTLFKNNIQKLSKPVEGREKNPESEASPSQSHLRLIIRGK